MLTCKEISTLVSESLDRKLSLRQRMAMRMHLLMCSMCRTYSRQMLVLRKVIRRAVNADYSREEHLPEDARTRIRQTLQQQQEADSNK